MVKKYIVDKTTISHLVEPYKTMINEYKGYMIKNIKDEKGNYDKIVNIGKSFVIIKDYVNTEEFKDDYFSSLLISDINSCLYCIKENLPKRFFYFSLRASIESFARLNILDKDTRIVDSVFKEFQELNGHIISDNELYSDFFSVIKSKYSISSGYVHGSETVSFVLKESIEELSNSNSSIDTQEMISELQIVLDLFKKFYLTRDNHLLILKHQYDRRMIILKYLLSKVELKTLF